MAPLLVLSATRDAVRQVAHNLRPEDRREVRAATGMEPAEATMASWRISEECYTVRTELGQSPFAVFGVNTRLGHAGIWLLATPAIRHAWLRMIEEAPKHLSRLAQKYGPLYNYVDVRNSAHLRWCLKVGFNTGPSIKVGSHDFIQVVYK